MGEVHGPDLLRPQSGEDVHVGLGIQFPSSTGCNHLSSVHDPYGIRNTWLSPSWLGLSSSEMATLKNFRAASHVGLVTLRLSRGEFSRWVSLLQLWLRWAQVVLDVASSLWKSFSILSVPS